MTNEAALLAEAKAKLEAFQQAKIELATALQSVDDYMSELATVRSAMARTLDDASTESAGGEKPSLAVESDENPTPAPEVESISEPDAPVEPAAEKPTRKTAAKKTTASKKTDSAPEEKKTSAKPEPEDDDDDLFGSDYDDLEF